MRLSGKEIGTVTAVEFAGSRIDVAFELNQEVRPLVTTDSVAAIGSLSLLGESIIDIKASPTGTPLTDWQYLKTVERRHDRGFDDDCRDSFEGGERTHRRRAGRPRHARQARDRRRAVPGAEPVLVSAGDVTRGLNQGRGTLGSLLKDPAAYAAMKASLENLQVMTAPDQRGAGGAWTVPERRGDGQVALRHDREPRDRRPRRLGRGDSTLGKLLTERELYDRLTSLSTRLDQVVGGLEEGRGTVGLLLRDRQLYETMNRAVTEMRDLLADIRKDPKKYLRVSVSIF